MKELKSIGVKITRAERRGRKTIIVFESDLYSDEPFVTTPFYKIDDKKDRLQDVTFDMKITEKDGNIRASVNFSNDYHSTKGFSQIHNPLRTHFLNEKDCARGWLSAPGNEQQFLATSNEILKLWSEDKPFSEELKSIINQRKAKIKLRLVENAKKEFTRALENLQELMGE